MLKNEHGASMIESMIGTTITLAGIMSMLHLNNESIKIKNMQTENFEMQRIMSDIRTKLSSHTICSSSLNHINLASPDKALSIIKDGQEIYGKGIELNTDGIGLEIANLEFENIDLPETGIGQFNVVLQFEKKYGSKHSRKYRFPLTGKSNAGVVTQCADSAVMAISTFCESMGGTVTNDRCEGFTPSIIASLPSGTPSAPTAPSGGATGIGNFDLGSDLIPEEMKDF